MKAEIRDDIVKAGVRYISIGQVVNDYVNGVSETKDIDYESVLGGEIKIASTGQKVNIIAASVVKGSNSFTITVRPQVIEDIECEIIDNTNCVFDVKKIENRLIELGVLEDKDYELIKSVTH